MKNQTPTQKLTTDLTDAHKWAKESFETRKKELLEAIEVNPANEIKWSSEGIMRSQHYFVGLDRVLMYLNGNPKESFDAHCKMVYNQAFSLISACVNNTLCGSTGMAHNLDSLMQREGEKQAASELLRILHGLSEDILKGNNPGLVMQVATLKPLFY